MVHRNLPRFQNVIGVLAASLAIHVGCSDSFDGCEASRTCPPEGGESGTGSGGESGDANTGGSGIGTNTGGSSISRGGSAGADNPGGETGEGGMAGASEDAEPPTIVSFAPADGDEDVERDIAITATFSEPIDERSVTTMSVSLTGPEGDVSGMLSVDANVVSFVPSRKLWLLGDYVLNVTDAVADLAGNALDEGASVGFRIRDGRWSEPTLPFGTTVPMSVSQFQHNALGDMVLGMNRSGASSIVLFGAAYHAAGDEWSAATELVTNAYFPNFGVAIDGAGRAVASWSDSVAHGWWRTTNGAGWVDAGALDDLANVTVTLNGLATAAWWNATSSSIQTRTMDLRNGALEPPGNIDMSSSAIAPHPVASLDRTAILAMTRPSTGDEVLSVSWKDGFTWTQPEQLAAAPRIFAFTFDSDEQGNIIVVWTENDRIWSRVYDRAADSWSEEQFVAATSSNASVGRVVMTNGNAILYFSSQDPARSTWVAVYEAGNGWLESSLVRLDEQQSSAAGIALDDAGNGIAICVPAALGTQFRRYVAGSGWQSPSTPPIGFHADVIYAAAAFDRSVSLVTSTVAGNLLPRAIRFE